MFKTVLAQSVLSFEPLDILLAVDMMLAQIEREEPEVEIAYHRGVAPDGNREALKFMERVFTVAEADWRGIGKLPQSGLNIGSGYRNFDAESAFPVELPPSREPQGCLCGEILRGVKTPLHCKLFGKACTPDSPVGPCMVSSEGTCAAYYLYGDNNE